MTLIWNSVSTLRQEGEMLRSSIVSRISERLLSLGNGCPALVRGELIAEEVDGILKYVTDSLRIESYDMMVVAELDSSSFGDIEDFCSTVPFGEVKLIAVNVTRASDRAQLFLLKLLDTLSDSAKVV